MAAVPELLEQQEEDRSKVRSLPRSLPGLEDPAGLLGLGGSSLGLGPQQDPEVFPQPPL